MQLVSKYHAGNMPHTQTSDVQYLGMSWNMHTQTSDVEMLMFRH